MNEQYVFRVADPGTAASYLIPPRYAGLDEHRVSYDVPGLRFFVQRDGSYRSAPVREHGARLAYDCLLAHGVHFDYEAVPGPPPLAVLDAAQVALAAQSLPYMRQDVLAAQAVKYGMMFRPWQPEAVSRALAARRYLAAHAPGAGKTLEGILFSLIAMRAQRVQPGELPTILLLSTLKPTRQVQDEWNHYVDLPTFRYKAKVHRRKRDKPLAEYLAQCASSKRPAVIILGFENMADVAFPAEDEVEGDASFLADMRRSKARNVVTVIDEIHKLKSHTRWEGEPGSWSLKGNQAAAVFWLLNKGATFGRHEDAVTARFGLSGTPLDNRVIDLWAQFDLLDQYSFGSYYDFGTRYGGGGPGKFTMFEATGATHLDELGARMEYVRHIVLSEEIAPYLPAFEERVKRVPKAAQVKATGGNLDGSSTKLTASLRSAAKALRDVESATRDEKATMYLCGIAAQAVRPVVVDDAIEALRAGQKVLIFTMFCNDVIAIWSDVVRRLGGKLDKDAGPAQLKVPITVKGIFVGATYGELHNVDQRTDIVKAYNDREEAACLIGTGDSIGESFNIENTNWILFASLPITPGKRIQQVGRVKDRQRRTRAATAVYYVGEGTYAERMVDILQPKEAAVKALGFANNDNFTEQLRGSEDERAKAAAAYVKAFLAGADLSDWSDDDAD